MANFIFFVSMTIGLTVLAASAWVAWWNQRHWWTDWSTTCRTWYHVRQFVFRTEHDGACMLPSLFDDGKPRPVQILRTGGYYEFQVLYDGAWISLAGGPGSDMKSPYKWAKEMYNYYTEVK